MLPATSVNGSTLSLCVDLPLANDKEGVSNDTMKHRAGEYAA